MFAQNNVQLFDQVRLEGYSHAELGCIINAYEFAVCMFTGRFQPSGNTFLSHVVRTASILTSLRVPAEVVAAGLLHSVYRMGDFGDAGLGVSMAKRRQVKEAVGLAVEKYIYRFETHRLNLENLINNENGIDNLDSTDRNIILMRLANELEHHLDLEILYYGKRHTESLNRHKDIKVKIANRLGFPKLAMELKRAYRRVSSTDVSREIRKFAGRKRPLNVIRINGDHESQIIVPRSCRKR